MEVGDLIIRLPETPIAHQFRANEIKATLFIQNPPDVKHGLVCFIDKYGEQPTEDCRGFRIHKIPNGKKVAIVRPCTIPIAAWNRAFPLMECNLTTFEQAKAALDALDIQSIVKYLSTYTFEELLVAKGIERSKVKTQLTVILKIEEAFTLLSQAIQEAHEATQDPTILMLIDKLSGWKGEALRKCKVEIENA